MLGRWASNLIDKSENKKKDADRKEIILAAAEVFFRDGYSSSSIDRIGEQIGCTKGRIYYYYGNKVDILLDIHREAMDLNITEIQSVLEDYDKPSSRLREMLVRHALLIINYLPLQAVGLQGLDYWLRGSTTPQQRQVIENLIQLRDRYEKMFVEVIEEGIQAREFRPGNVRVIVKVLLGGLNWMTFWYRMNDNQNGNSRRYAEELVEVQIKGVLQ